jgi:putative transposase
MRESHWESAPSDAWALALTREAVIRPLAEAPRLSHAVADVAAATLGISRSLVYRLVAQFRDRPQTSTLLRRKRGLSVQTSLLAPPLERLITDAIDEVYLQPERARISDLIRVIDARCAERGWSKPAFRTIKRRLDRLDPRTVAHRRLGSRAARHLFDPVRDSTLTPTMPLEVMQIDHTPVDVVIVDERQRLPIGRPWLTLAIDVASRVVLGLSVSLDAPSVVSVALALTHAVLPKDIWLADRELEVPWAMVGVPDALHLDNAPEFHSAALARGAQEYGMRLTFRPPAQPHFGGHIERLIGTMMGAVHLLPGTTFSNVVEKADNRPEERAALTLTEAGAVADLGNRGRLPPRRPDGVGDVPAAKPRATVSRSAVSHPVNPPTDRPSFLIFCPVSVASCVGMAFNCFVCTTGITS